MNPYFSIIIPTLNEEKNLPILLNSLADQTYRDFEVIICDGGSVDKTRELALGFNSLLPLSNFHQYNVKNVAGARNKGASLSTGKYCVFFDSDVKIEKVFLEEIKKHFEEDKMDVLTVWNRPESNTITSKTVFFLLNFFMTISQNIKPGANGPCIIMNRDFFNKIGGFDETIIFGEDFFLIQKAHNAHARFKVYPKPLLYVSGRRFEKEGFVRSLGKSLKAFFHQMLLGPIRKPIFDYEMGGQYYEKK